MSKTFALAGAAILALGATPGFATDFILNYTATSGTAPTTAFLYITASDTLNSAGGYDVLNVTGNVDGDVLTSFLVNPNQPNQSTSPDGRWFYDNVLFADGDPIVSNNGLAFSSDTIEYNLYSNGPGAYELEGFHDGVYDPNSTGTLTISEAPEPVSWAMFIGGFGLLGGSLRRQRRTVVATTFA